MVDHKITFGFPIVADSSVCPYKCELWPDCARESCPVAQEQILLDAVQKTYRKHHLGDESIGWDELGETLLDALCNAMSDEGFQAWLKTTV